MKQKSTHDKTCASCLHLSLDGRFCHNWHRYAEITESCSQHYAPQYIKENSNPKTTNKQ